MPTKHETIVRPLITEKSSAAYQDRGEYTFQVHPNASKPQIRQAIEDDPANPHYICTRWKVGYFFVGEEAQ